MKIPLAILVVLFASACGQESSKTGETQKQIGTDDMVTACTSTKTDEAASDCLSEVDANVKQSVAATLKAWEVAQPKWSSSLIDTHSFSVRYRLNRNQTNCLKSYLCI